MLDTSAPPPKPVLATRLFLERDHKMWIGGKRRSALSGKTFDVHNPATGARIATVPDASVEDVDLAVIAARKAFDERVWRGLSIDDRARILWRFAELVESNAVELAEIDIINNGMNRALGDGMVAAAASWLRSFAGETQRIYSRNASEAMSSNAAQFHAYSLREPVGVAGLICAWNGPLGAFIVKVGTALAAGCSVIMKPAENTPLSALRLAELAHEAGVPAGVINVVTGFGATGEAIVEHPGVDKISFTGSTAVGKRIVGVAASTLKRVTLELGGKSPSAIFDDADLDQAIPTVAMGIYLNAGQICSAGSRLYVQRKVYDKVVAGITDFACAIKLGNGLDPANDMGPLISARQHERVMSYIEAGREAGAEILAGGEAPDGAGHFINPTIFANVNADMKIVREEIFGPVLVVTPFDNADEYVAQANETRYGLASGIFTSNVDRVHQIASKLQAGNVWVNCYSVNHPALPFGGYKESGWGHEMGEEGPSAYLSTKSVFIKLGQSY